MVRWSDSSVSLPTAHLRNRFAILTLDTVFLLATASSGSQSMATMRAEAYEL